MQPVHHGFGVRDLLGPHAHLLSGTAPLSEPVTYQGDPTRFSPFAGIPQLTSAVAAMDAWDGTLKLARAWSPSSEAPFELYPTREQLRTLYDAGFTIVLENVESYVPALRPLCRQLEQDLGVAPGKVNVEVFCAQAGGRGRPHFDPSFTFNCQIEGTKLWKLSRNDALPFPWSGAFLNRPLEPELQLVTKGPLPRTLEEDAQTFLAEPGAVVFLPPGVLHETKMLSSSYAIAFAIEEVDSVVASAITRIQRTLRMDCSLRAPRLGRQWQHIDQEVGILSSTLRQLADEVDRDGAAWLQNQVVELRVREGLTLEVVDERTLILMGESTSKTLTVDPSVVSILSWAAQKKSFRTHEVSMALGHLEPQVVSAFVDRLTEVGLLECA